MTKPITPQEVAKLQAECLPVFVLQTWNELIARNFKNGRSEVSQNEAVVALMDAHPGPLNRAAVFTNNWLEIEEVFRQSGWDVTYDKPGYNETYEAKFIFVPA